MDAGTVGHTGVLGVCVVIKNITGVSATKQWLEQESATIQSQITVENIVLEIQKRILKGLARLKVKKTYIYCNMRKTFFIKIDSMPMWFYRSHLSKNNS